MMNLARWSASGLFLIAVLAACSDGPSGSLRGATSGGGGGAPEDVPAGGGASGPGGPGAPGGGSTTPAPGDSALPGDLGLGPKIVSFTANPASIAKGQSTTLTWSVDGALGVSLTGFAAVTTQSQVVTLDATSTFTLTALGDKGVSLARLTVPVTGVDAPKEIFAATAGSDGAAGTQAAPVKTLGKALALAKDGDTITLADGSYPGAVTVHAKNLTIRSAPGAKAMISSSTSDANVGMTIDVDKEAWGLTLRGLDISGGYYYVIKTESNWDSGEMPEYGTSNLVVEDSRLHDSGRDCVKVTPGADNVVFRRTEIFNSGRRDPSNAEAIDAVNANNMLVQDCHIHDTTTNGIYPKGGSIAAVIERNLFEDIAYSAIVLGQDSDLEWFDTKLNPKYYENIDGIARNNIVLRAGGAGVAAWAAVRAKVYNNTLVDVAQSFMSGLLVNGQDKNGVVVPSVDPTFVNNIVVQKSGRAVFEVRDGALSGTLTASNNWYFHVGGAAQFSDVPASFSGGLAQWQTHIGETASGEGDPMLDATGHLLAGSPCIDKGKDLGAAVRSDIDKDLRPKGAGYDIGADEH